MITVAVGWQMYELTHSALALGLVGLASFGPLLALVFLVGHVVDHADRRKVAMICQSLQACAVGVLAVATLEHRIVPWLIYAVSALLGGLRAFEGPASLSLMPNLVPEAMIAGATARRSSAQQTAQIVGPAFGGLLYAAFPAAPYLCAAVLYGVTLAAFALIRPARARTPIPAASRSIFAGLHFIRRTPIVLGAISLDLFAVLLGGATALLPIYARDILFTGPWGLGLLRTAPAVGALVMSLAIGREPIKRRAGRTLIISVVVFGAATIVFGISHWFALSFAALAVVGASDVISVVIRSSMVAIQTPDEMRGRVNAVNSLFIGTSNQLGEFESGVTAALLGPVGAVVLGGAGSILVALLWARFFPDLAATDTLHGRPAPAAPNVSQLASAPPPPP